METLNKSFIAVAEELIASATVINGQIKVVHIKNFDQKKLMNSYLSEFPTENILLVEAYAEPFTKKRLLFGATFLTSELEGERFCEQMLNSDAYPIMWEKGLWCCQFTSDQPLEEFLNSLQSKLQSGELKLSKSFSWTSAINDLAVMRSGLSNDIREGFNTGMEEAQRVLYNFYCYATILQKSIEEASKSSFKNKMALTLLKGETEVFVQSEDYEICVELNKCGACHVLSDYRQNFVKRMIEILDEITK